MTQSFLSNFNLTPKEQKTLAEATTEQLAEAFIEIAKERSLWVELGAAVMVGFLEGFTRGLNDSF